MKNLLILFITATLVLSCQSRQEETMESILRNAVKNAEIQALALAEYTQPFEEMLPRTTNKKGAVILDDSRWWTSGFFPGTLWYIYEHTGNEKTKEYAWLYTKRVEREKYTTDNHDVGFMIYCSFGNALRLTGDSQIHDVILTASNSLSTRFRESVGCIQSWESSSKWECPVIIDNMMNLEMLMWAFKHSGDSTFYDIAVSHADKTLKNHFRSDKSSYHLVSYFVDSGEVQCKQTVQGYSDESSWARGQAWALYGYTMMHRETGNPAYLEQAKNIADYIVHHPNLPTDKIPYWDFNVPEIPDTPRDVSAGAIICSALLELSSFVEPEEKKNYLQTAETQLRALATEYTAPPGENGHFILKQSVGSFPTDSEVNVPQTYADYYYLEAITRYANMHHIFLN